MAVSSVVFYKSLILNTPKIEFLSHFPVCNFLEHHIEVGWISVFYKRYYKSSLTTAFICLPCGVFKVEGTTTSLSITSFSDSWSEDKLESKSESYSSTTSCSSFSMTSSSYIGRFIAQADWHGQYASWKFCCLLPNSKLSNTLSMFTCPFPHFGMLVLSMGTTGIVFNFAIAERPIASFGMG